jgi:hypothetical protein
MSSYSDRDVYSQTGSWLLGTVRRNPEALLLVAAGCCLMMRSGSASTRPSARVSQHMREGWDHQTSRASSQVRGASASARDGLSSATVSAADMAKTAGDYASQVKDRISDTASSYADSVADFADDARRSVAERSARLKQQTHATLQSSMQRVLREQPLAVAVAGLAAGAAVAALFPSTEIEGRAFGSTHEKLKDLAEEAGERTMEAAGKAGERLKSAAEERGLTSEGLKEAAGEVAGTFKDAISGKPENRSAASQAGGSAASGSGQSSGMEQNRQGSPGSGTTQPYPGGRSMR